VLKSDVTLNVYLRQRINETKGFTDSFLYFCTVSFCNISLCVCIQNKVKIDSATCPVVAEFDFKKLRIVTTGKLASRAVFDGGGLGG